MDVIRGTHAFFRATFVDEDNEPLVAADPKTYPAVQIKNPEGEVFFQGVGNALGTTGEYVFPWFVPEDAEINVPPNQWTIEWFFTNLHGHDRSTEEFFNVADKVIPDIIEHQYTYLARDGTRERLVLPLETKPAEIGLSIQNSGFNNLWCVGEVATDSKDASEGTPVGDRKIGLVIEDGMYKYYYNTEALTEGEYPVFWDVRETTASVKESYQQLIRVPENQYWLFNKPLRMLIDKLRKRLSTFQGYTEDEIYEFIIRGVGFVNGINPATDWTLKTIPTREVLGVAEAVIFAAAKYALTAQQVLETELAFDHGGQTVTLSMNRDYSSVISMIDDYLSKFAEAKPRINRILCRAGIVGVRPYWYGPRNRVWKMRDSQLAASSIGSSLALLLDF